MVGATGRIVFTAPCFLLRTLDGFLATSQRLRPFLVLKNEFGIALRLQKQQIKLLRVTLLRNRCGLGGEDNDVNVLFRLNSF